MTIADHLLGAGPAGLAQGHLPGAGLAEALAPLVACVAGRGRPTLVARTIAIPWRDPIAVFAAARRAGEEPAIWLQPADGVGLVGIGSAWEVRAAGPDRFRAVEAAWAGLLEGALVPDDAGSRRAAGPLLLGGFPFAPAALPPGETWRGFETARLVLPGLLVALTPEGAWLTASAVVPPDGEDPAAGIAASLEARWIAVERAADAPAVPAAPAAGRLRPASADRGEVWRGTVARLAGAVGRGRLDKVVLARQVDLEADVPLDVPATLRRLELSAPESTIFAIDRDGRTFLGATPERLVRCDGRTVRTVAMAGSIERGRDAADDDRLAAELLASAKEHEEHAVVVTMLRETLGPVVEGLEVDPGPTVARLRHVQHLVTQVRGRLREETGILALVDRLHPTPAVGGAPRDLALALIDEQEGLDRGWYAGPLGWIDRHGDGEFVVAIRSGVVAGRRASLFAGCGIVADSDPEREWEESRVKLRALASALGEYEG